MDGVILKVVVDDNFSDPVVLKRALIDTLLEVALESEHLLIVLKPLTFKLGSILFSLLL